MARDYRREYQRRVELGRMRGYSRAVARGHARVTELPAREHVRFEQALARALEGRTLNRAQRLAVESAIERLQEKRFVARAENAGLTNREAYTLFFSP